MIFGFYNVVAISSVDCIISVAGVELIVTRSRGDVTGSKSSMNIEIIIAFSESCFNISRESADGLSKIDSILTTTSKYSDISIQIIYMKIVKRSTAQPDKMISVSDIYRIATCARDYCAITKTNGYCIP